MDRLIRLARGKNGFFDPVSRFHLIGGIRPQDIYPAGLPLTESLKRGLKYGSLVDVNGSFKEELAGGTPSVNAPVATATIAPDQTGQQAVVPPITQQMPAGYEFDYETAVTLTLDQINVATKKDMVAFIEGNSIALVDLDLNSRSKEDEYKEALKKHFNLV